jgi:Protein of unknown function (DUF4244)
MHLACVVRRVRAATLDLTGESPVVRGRRLVRPGSGWRSNQMRALLVIKDSFGLARLRAAADDAGMTTAEYAVGTVAACGFAGVLFKVLTSDAVITLLTDIVRRALTLSI